MSSNQERQLEFYDKLYRSRSSNNEFSPVLLWYKDLLRGFMPFFDVASVSSVLDVGCGDGAHTLILSRFFPEASVVGVDISGGY